MRLAEGTEGFAQAVMPGLVPGIHVVRPGANFHDWHYRPDVDGRDKPGHDSTPPHAAGRFIRATGSNPSAATSSSIRTAPASSSFFAAM